MELREFVAESLRQLIDGVAVAQEYATENDAKVNPTNIFYRADQGVIKIQDRETGALVQEVNFDVAVTATDGTKTKGGIGVFVGAVGLGSQGQSEASNQSISRIRFSVPLALPVARVSNKG